jgi:hypothetical protein
MPSLTFLCHPEAILARPGALQRTHWFCDYLAYAQHEADEFAAPAPGARRRRSRSGEVALVNATRTPLDWDTGRPDFLRLVRLAGLDVVEAARLDLELRGLLLTADQVTGAVAGGWLDERGRRSLERWPEVVGDLARIEDLTWALLEARDPLPAANSESRAAAESCSPAAPTTPAGPMAGGGAVGRSSLAPCHERALAQYRHALVTSSATDRELGDDSTDQAVYRWIAGRDDDGEVGALPQLKTWCRYLRVARDHYGLSKSSSRRGRPTGGSVVRQSQI